MLEQSDDDHIRNNETNYIREKQVNIVFVIVMLHVHFSLSALLFRKLKRDCPQNL